MHRQLMCDVPYGVLISGGLDSSVVAAVAAKFSARRIEEDDRAPAWWPRLHSFAIGLAGRARPRPGAGGGRAHRRRAPRGALHGAGGPRRADGRHLPPRDLRRDDDPGSDADVPDGAEDPRDGHQDDPVGRGGRRGVRRLPLLPQGARRPRAARRDGAQAPEAAPLRLPARQQGVRGLGRRGARAVPRPRVPRRRDVPRSRT